MYVRSIMYKRVSNNVICFLVCVHNVMYAIIASATVTNTKTQVNTLNVEIIDTITYTQL